MLAAVAGKRFPSSRGAEAAAARMAEQRGLGLGLSCGTVFLKPSGNGLLLFTAGESFLHPPPRPRQSEQSKACPAARLGKASPSLTALSPLFFLPGT